VATVQVASRNKRVQRPATPAQLHWSAVKQGALDILVLFDNLPWFKTGADWTAWRAFLCATYGLPMSQKEHDIFRKCTGRKDAPKQKAREVWGIMGRRARKSAVAATIGVYEGGFRDHSKYLAPGERGRVLVISKDKDDAGTIHSFAKAILSEPSLSHLLLDDPTAETIRLSNNVDIQTRAAKVTAGRSKTVIAALYDELAFWPTEESATPDQEIIRGVEPAMANVPNPLTIGMSSPYAQRGVLHQKFRDHWGENGDVLVWNADTLSMHDTPQIRVFVKEQWDSDPASAAAEVGQDGRVAFRTDVETFITDDIVQMATIKGRRELRPERNVSYVGFVDPSGGSSDSMTLAIAHWDSAAKRAVLDCLREVTAPFDPEVAVEQFRAMLKAYSLSKVVGDRYAGTWPATRFRRPPDDNPWSVFYVVSDKTKSDIYRDFLPLLNSGSVELLDVQKLRTQLTGLDRHVARGGKDSIDHAPGSHDDVANVVAGVLLLADKLKGSQVVSPKHFGSAVSVNRGEEYDEEESGFDRGPYGDSGERPY
jgi:hypothetical protein